MQHALEVSAGPVMIKDPCRSQEGHHIYFIGTQISSIYGFRLHFRAPVLHLSLSGVSLFCFEIQAGPPSRHCGGRAFSYDEAGPRVMDPFSSNIP